MAKEFDNPNIVSEDITCNGSAVVVSVGFDPRKVEIVQNGGYCCTAYNGITNAVKFNSSGVELASGVVTFNGDNTITLGADVDLNVSGAKTKVIAYK